jgi:hypothetical protein
VREGSLKSSRLWTDSRRGRGNNLGRYPPPQTCICPMLAWIGAPSAGGLITTWSHPTTCTAPSPGSGPASRGSPQAPFGPDRGRGRGHRITAYRPHPMPPGHGCQEASETSVDKHRGWGGSTGAEAKGSQAKRMGNGAVRCAWVRLRGSGWFGQLPRRWGTTRPSVAAPRLEPRARLYMAGPLGSFWWLWHAA